MEELLDNVEEKHDDSQANQLTKHSTSSDEVTKVFVNKTTEDGNVPADDDNDEESEDERVGSKCSKRMMNESIMSLDDPMLAMDSKKLKNRTLNDSIMECADQEFGNNNIENVSFVVLYFFNILN